MVPYSSLEDHFGKVWVLQLVLVQSRQLLSRKWTILTFLTDSRVTGGAEFALPHQGALGRISQLGAGKRKFPMISSQQFVSRSLYQFLLLEELHLIYHF